MLKPPQNFIKFGLISLNSPNYSRNVFGKICIFGRCPKMTFLWTLIFCQHYVFVKSWFLNFLNILLIYIYIYVLIKCWKFFIIIFNIWKPWLRHYIRCGCKFRFDHKYKNDRTYELIVSYRTLLDVRQVSSYHSTSCFISEGEYSRPLFYRF